MIISDKMKNLRAKTHTVTHTIRYCVGSVRAERRFHVFLRTLTQKDPIILEELRLYDASKCH